MEPRISPGSSGMYEGMSDGGHFQHFGLYGRPEYGPVAAGEIPSSFLSSFYNLEMAGVGEEEQLDRAMAASRNHREAEKRRRERIKSHLDRLRSILACDAKIEKASLLAKAVEHMRDLKQRAAEIDDMDHFPSETDEISVYTGDLPTASGRSRPVIKASLCCEDRSGLLPELAETLKSLRLRVLRAEIATLGGRVRNVLVVAGDDSGEEEEEVSGSGGQAAFLRDALKALVDRSGSAGGLERPKRRRVLNRSGAATA